MTKVLNWNVRWAAAASERGAEISRELDEHAPDIACLTEVRGSFFDDASNTIFSHADYGYASPPDRRKVMLWSRWGWTDTDDIGHPSMPSGRYVSGFTETSDGPLKVIGVCVPWDSAHVITGRKDRTRWEDHLTFLAGLKALIEAETGPFVLLGDFNQTLPRTRAPMRVVNAIEELREVGVKFATEGLRDENGKLGIDHIALSHGLRCERAYPFSKSSEGGMVLSDHFGVCAEVAFG